MNTSPLGRAYAAACAYAPLCLIALLIAACSHEPTVTEPVDEPGSITVEFDNIVGDHDLQLASGTYTNAAGEPYSVDVLKYYVSNIELIATNGTTYTVPADSSYFLIDESVASSQEVHIDNIPAGTYSSIRFVLGVDSARSVSDISRRTGALDPATGAEGMYWTWNSGYIFFKMEGTSRDSAYMYHIGGFGGMNAPTVNNVRSIALSMTATRIDEEHTATVHVLADIAKVFDGPTPFSIAEYHDVMFADFSTTISANYATMFTVDHVHASTHSH